MADVAQVEELGPEAVPGVPVGAPESSEIVSEAVPETPFDEPKTEKRQRQGGRIAVSQIPEAVRGAMPFPVAPRSTLKGGSIPEDKFFAYWYGLPKYCKDRQIVYIQRMWPVVNYALMMSSEQAATFDRTYPAGTRKPGDIDAYLRKCGITKYIEKYTDHFESRDWRTEILRRHGSGDYLLFLNDTGVPGNPNIKRETICTTLTQLRDDQYPPVIDINILDMYDPKNASFIQERRLRGLPLPGDQDEQQQKREIEEEDMAAVTEQILADNREMRQQVVELAKERRKEDERPTTQPQSAPDVKALSDAHQKSMELLADANRKALEIAAAANNPQVQLDNAFKLADRMAGDRKADGGSNGMKDMFEAMLKSQAEHHRQMMEMQQKAHDRELVLLEKLMVPSATTSTAVAPQSFTDLAKQYREAKKIFAGEDEESKEPDMPWWAQLADRFLEAAPKLAGDFMENLAKLKQADQQHQTQPGQPQTQTIAPAQEDPKVKQEATLANYIRQPILDAMTQHYKGYEFAGNVIVSYGLPAYHNFVREGESGLTGFLMRTGLHQGLVQRFGAEAVGQFITEFLDLPKAQEIAAQLRQLSGQQAPAPNGAPAPGGGPKVNRGPVQTQ